MLQLLLFIGFLITGCVTADSRDSTTEQVASQQQLASVDLATASLGSAPAREYIGTTQPATEVSLRSQVEGRLLELSVAIGKNVIKGQEIGKLDDSLLAAVVSQEREELASLKSEVARAEIEVKDAQIQLEQAQIQLEQAKSDAARYGQLAKTGLIAEQQAESYRTAAQTAQQTVFSAREAIAIQRQAVDVAKSRVAAQQAAIAEAEQRWVYTQLLAPISGTIIAKAAEPGDVIQTGEEIVTIGNFQEVEVVVPISELDLSRVNLGQSVRVKLDAFSDRTFSGKVTQIAPTTSDSVARQIAVQVTVDNPDNLIKGGLLARVDFETTATSEIEVPEAAVIEEEGVNYLFVVTQTNDRQATVTKRQVKLGDRTNGNVEVLSGIRSGERFVLRSSQPLKDGETVALSIISE
ncbi:efflux RND transporter periplasmic adaptor subunit [Myxosarcina sp. GI1]|uniref:efflux RND transporter periplasmic adaptor subunit n=1 Tax=Myxosarcina sp. GI1 TaxID=1541065 RepID=UPI000567BC35|nr:efflux RND transporter periplasmic adaptor subunit [Myxosarcina sp. GI1]